MKDGRLDYFANGAHVDMQSVVYLDQDRNPAPIRATEVVDLIRQWLPDVVLTDVKMPGMDGVELFRRLKEIDPTITTIIMTGFATVEMAVEALKNGVYDFFQKPFDNDQILHAVSRAMERTWLLRENRRYQELQAKPEEGEFYGFVGNSPRLRQVEDLLRRLAPSDMTVLIRGESGTGKELAARALHGLSGRAGRKMVTVNCPALPEHILESELFGYCKGAFTGADHDKVGLFVEADRSTILLDEIADIPVSIQTKLLRVLQEKEVQPLGQTRTLPVDVRVVASTNQDIEAKISRGEFREDLFYRLNVVTVTMPSLEAIRSDIPLLIHHFLRKYRREYERPGLEFSEEAIQSLLRRPWRGNVRELQNTINRAVLLGTGPKIERRDLMLDVEMLSPESGPDQPAPGFEQLLHLEYAGAKEAVLREFTASYLRAALTRTKGNISLAAKGCGMERQALQRLLRRYQISLDGFRR
ncbi:MAG: sigma-54-dependent Fis family transcriptional regulator [Desulfobulbaceae bacterium]|nr:MAG: sigma-54-dependent Fis family transcriptional regulator [Desulfobulbaceae bacterium]